MRFMPGMRTAFDGRAEWHDEFVNDWDSSGFYKASMQLMQPTEGTTRCLCIGVGTGYELKWLFEAMPLAEVVGVDVSSAMLSILKRNYKERSRQIELINLSVFDFDFPDVAFDYVTAHATMHHFNDDQRMWLYQNFCKTLKDGGMYLEADKFVSASVSLFAKHRLRTLAKKNPYLSDETSHIFVHNDIPTTLRDARRRLIEAGFSDVNTACEGFYRSGAVITGRRPERRFSE